MKAGIVPPLGQILQDAEFPADRATLVRHAERHGAPDDLITTLKGLPEGSFRNILEVNRFAGLSGQAGQGDPEPWKVAVTGKFPADPEFPPEGAVGTPRLPAHNAADPED